MAIQQSAVGERRRRGGLRLGMQETLWGLFFISPWIVGFIIFAFSPIVTSFWLSLNKYEVISPPEWVGLANYTKFLLEDPLFSKSLYNTFYYVILSVPLGMAVALALAMLLNLNLRGVSIFRTIFYVPMVAPVVAASLLWLWLFNPQFGILNYLLTRVGLPPLGWISDPVWSKPSLILMSLWTVGGTMLIFLAGLQGIPTHLYEAAQIDGANNWQRFLHVTLPMLSSVIFFNLVLGVIASFQTFTQAYVMTGGGPVDSTLFYALYLYRNAFKLLQMGYASAMAWVLLVIILVLTWLQFRLGRSWVYYEGESTK